MTSFLPSVKDPDGDGRLLLQASGPSHTRLRVNYGKVGKGITVDRAALLEALGAVEQRHPVVDHRGRRIHLTDGDGDRLEVQSCLAGCLQFTTDNEEHRTANLDEYGAAYLYEFIGDWLRRQDALPSAPTPPAYFELLRQHPAGHFIVTQEVEQGQDCSGPDEAVAKLEDPRDGEIILVRWSTGGGITVFEVEAATTRFRRVSPEPVAAAGPAPVSAAERLANPCAGARCESSDGMGV